MNESFDTILRIIPKLKEFMAAHHLTENFEEIRMRVNQNAEIYTFTGGYKTDVHIGKHDILSISKIVPIILYMLRGCNQKRYIT